MGFRTLVTAVQDEEQGAAMLNRSYFLHYHTIRKAVMAALTVGAAVLVSYLILQARF